LLQSLSPKQMNGAGTLSCSDSQVVSFQISIPLLQN